MWFWASQPDTNGQIHMILPKWCNQKLQLNTDGRVVAAKKGKAEMSRCCVMSKKFQFYLKKKMFWTWVVTYLMPLHCAFEHGLSGKFNRYITTVPVPYQGWKIMISYGYFHYSVESDLKQGPLVLLFLVSQYFSQ